MKELDLHGLKHYDVKDTVENFVLMNNTPIRIITGKSDKMRDMVKLVLEKHKFKYHTPAHNSGEIIIVD